MLLNVRDVSVGENQNIEFGLAISMAGEGAISWAVMWAGEGAGTETLRTLGLTEGSSGKRRAPCIAPTPHHLRGSSRALHQEEM